jgi:hypothetical protein
MQRVRRKTVKLPSRTGRGSQQSNESEGDIPSFLFYRAECKVDGGNGSGRISHFSLDGAGQVREELSDCLAAGESAGRDALLS